MHIFCWIFHPSDASAYVQESHHIEAVNDIPCQWNPSILDKKTHRFLYTPENEQFAQKKTWEVKDDPFLFGAIPASWQVLS